MDPKPSDAVSPYTAMNNNLLLYNDPLGDTIILRNDGRIISNDGIGNGVYVHHFRDNSNHFIGQIGGKIDANEIFSNLLSKDIKAAKKIWDPRKFRNYVTDGGKWDLKLQKGTIWKLANDNKTMFSFDGKSVNSQDMGNFHFGAVAKAYGLFPERFILKQAGLNQMSKPGDSKRQWQRYQRSVTYGIFEVQPPIKTVHYEMLPPYDDDAVDQYWIEQGFR